MDNEKHFKVYEQIANKPYNGENFENTLEMLKRCQTLKEPHLNSNE